MNTRLLSDSIWPAGGNALVRNAALVVLGSLLVAVAAQITVPMWPVPMTLQSMAVLAVGAAYGARLGAATLGLYALEGAIGLPVFADGRSGLFDAKLDYLLPASSMGYVAGFVLAAWLVGRLVESGFASNLLKWVLATLAGAVALYVPGLLWLAVWAAKTQGMDAGAAIAAALNWGLYPFVFGDAVKVLIVGLAVPAAGLALSRR